MNSDKPWLNEPDRLEWKTAAGYPALAVRQPKSLHWCGYVAVPPGHPCHGRSFDREYEKDATGEDDYDRPIHNPVLGLDVHGGITYAEPCAGKVCHVPAPGEPDDVHWLGFDCAHGGDVSPGWAWSTEEIYRGARYRDLPYVRAEAERLAEQLKAMEKP